MKAIHPLSPPPPPTWVPYLKWLILLVGMPRCSTTPYIRLHLLDSMLVTAGNAVETTNLLLLQASFAASASTQTLAGPPPPAATPSSTPRSTTTPRLSRQSSNITPSFSGVCGCSHIHQILRLQCADGSCTIALYVTKLLDKNSAVSVNSVWQHNTVDWLVRTLF